MTDLTSLNRQFGIPDVAKFEPGEGGLTRLVIRTKAAEAELYLHGAHVTRFQPRGEKPVLFMSGKSHFQPGKPIRGGVPICFPWFGPKAGDPAAPAHGFARLMEWTVESVTRKDDGSIAATLALHANDFTRPQWPAEFTARYTVTVGSILGLALDIVNNGSAPVQFQEALHTYLTVGDVRQVSIDGFAGSSYIDKMVSGIRPVQGDEPIRFTGETDRIYLASRSTCTVHDPVLGRLIKIVKSGSDTTVVWNPWIAKAKAMPDFGDDEWPGMVCVETCNVAEHAVTLAPGATHTLTAAVSVAH